MKRLSTCLILPVLWAAIATSAYASPPVNEIREILAQKSLWKISEKTLASLNGASVDKALSAIDPYARYVPPLAETQNGSRSGLGLELLISGGRVWVKPLPKGPAKKSGLPEIGVLVSVEGKPVRRADLSDVSRSIDNGIARGGVVLGVSEQIGQAVRLYRVKPERFASESVEYSRVADYLVIRIREFVAHDTAASVEAIYATLVKEQTSVIFDLRGCAGGDFGEALRLAGDFLAQDTNLVSTYDRFGLKTVYTAPAGQKFRQPEYILVDSATASAAEVFAGVLRYYRLSRLVGTRTFGKCVSQTFARLSDGGELWYTNLMIVFPDGTSCSKRGLKPDRVVAGITTKRIRDIVAALP